MPVKIHLIFPNRSLDDLKPANMSSVEIKQRLSFLEDGGQCGKLIRAYSWADTPLGEPNSWPQNLRTSIDIVLHSKFPMILLWGDELIQFYNDAFIPNFGASGRHPDAIGSSAIGTWPEIWDYVKPLLDRVRHERASFFIENQKLAILRNGKIEDSYWTFSYSPITESDGSVAGIFCVCQETAELVISVSKLQESEAMLSNTAERLQLALEAGQMGAYELDLSTGYIDCNMQCKRNFGLKADDKFYFEELLEMIFDEDRPAMQAAVDKAIREKVSYEAQYRIRTKTGELRWIDARGNAVYDKKGVPFMIIGVTRNFTGEKNFSEVLEQKVKENTAELAELNTELSKTNQDLMFSNQELSQYAYVASHDLQEPLRKIMVYSNLISGKSELPDNQKTWAVKIQQSADRMSRLIQDLLVFSKLSEADRNYVPVDLTAIVDNVLTDFEVAIEEKKAEVNIGPLCVIEGINLQMNQLFANLLSNSLKFAVTGRKPVINLRSEQISDHDLKAYDGKLVKGISYCRLVFSDNGVGFDESYAEQVFEVFRRLHGNENYPGSGIGLALCKRIVNNHRGYIEANSKPGMGTTISLILPVHQPS